MTSAAITVQESFKPVSISRSAKKIAVGAALAALASCAIIDGYRESKGAVVMLREGYTSEQIRFAYSMDGCYQYYPGGQAVGFVKSTLARPWVEYRLLINN